MESSLTSILPNLAIGTVAVLALAWVTRAFLTHLEVKGTEARQERQEAQGAMRELEKEVRSEIMGQLSKNTAVMERVVQLLRQ